MVEPGEELSLEEVVAYCHTQARLLHGRAETLDEETAAILSAIDEGLSAARSQLAEHGDEAPSPSGPDVADDELDELEAIETDLGEKQAEARAKQSRREAVTALAADYLDIAATLEDESPTASAALERVLQFELDHDAPSYFEDRVTLVEAASDTAGES